MIRNVNDMDLTDGQEAPDFLKLAKNWIGELHGPDTSIAYAAIAQAEAAERQAAALERIAAVLERWDAVRNY